MDCMFDILDFLNIESKNENRFDEIINFLENINDLKILRLRYTSSNEIQFEIYRIIHCILYDNVVKKYKFAFRSDEYLLRKYKHEEEYCTYDELINILKYRFNDIKKHREAHIDFEKMKNLNEEKYAMCRR